MKRYLKYTVALLGLLMTAGLAGCQDKFPTNVESTDFTVLEEIRIVNAGSSGDQVVVGKVDEDSKTIWFPRIEPDSDLQNLKFQAVMSDGAVLEQDTYALDYAEGESEKTIVLKVVNNKRFREYFATVRLNVPVYGAEWSQAQVYDFSANPEGNEMWPDYGGLDTRSGGFSSKWVAIPSRGTSHLLSTEEILSGATDPTVVSLNMTGVSGGTFVINGAEVIGEHIYMASLAGNAIPNIYYWNDPAEPPIKISEGLTNPDGIDTRVGDTFNMHIDEQGNGYMFFGENNSSPNAFIRITVTNWTELSDPVRLGGFPWMGTWSFYTHIEDTPNYLVTSLQMGDILWADASGNTSVAIPSGILPQNAGDPRVIHFKGERYLLTVDGARSASHGTPAIRVYNITQGATVEEALQIVRERGTIENLYEWSIGGGVNGAPGTKSGYAVIKDAEGNDDKLLVYGAVADSGFAVIEFPAKVLDE